MYVTCSLVSGGIACPESGTLHSNCYCVFGAVVWMRLSTALTKLCVIDLYISNIILPII